MTYIDTTYIDTTFIETDLENFVDKYAICTLNVDEVVGHLKKGKTFSFFQDCLLFSYGRKEQFMHSNRDWENLLTTLAMDRVCKECFALYSLQRKENVHRSPTTTCRRTSMSTAFKQRIAVCVICETANCFVYPEKWLWGNRTVFLMNY